MESISSIVIVIAVIIIILITMTASLTGDWLRDRLDPKLRRKG